MASCGARQAPEVIAPGWERGAVPGLQGARVLLLPVQDPGGVEGIDEEIEFALSGASAHVTWVGSRTLARLTSEAGRLGANPRDLPVGAFERGRLDRIGDPLFGSVYRLAAFADAGIVLLPLSARAAVGDSGRETIVVDLLLLDPRTGRVMWQGLVEGPGGAPGTRAPAAGVAEQIAERLVR